ncbi:MAG: hypothetical protein NHG36_11385, partial [Chromatiaceae bacterium]|nr:hypothetical protein [Candidatus Thioaporhodococcus sediminis]
GLLVNISGNKSITLFEVKTAMDFIKNAASAEAHVFYGQVFDDALEDRFLVTVIATGFPPARRASARRAGVRPAAVETIRSGTFRPPAADAPLLDDDLRRPAYWRRKVRKLT